MTVEGEQGLFLARNRQEVASEYRVGFPLGAQRECDAAVGQRRASGL